MVSAASLALGGKALGARMLAPPTPDAAPDVPAAASSGKRVLVLGGTGFLGPKVMEAALARGHHVTLFNRGRLEKMRKLEFPAGVDVLYGNRDPGKPADEWKDEARGDVKDPNSPIGLSQLEGKTWDYVIDTSGQTPAQVEASAQLLADKVKHYVFISTLSVYASNDVVGMDESAPVAQLVKDAPAEQAPLLNYGPNKALSEQAAEAAMPGRVANLRSGLIVGPGDYSDRYTYWPVRLDQGGEVLCPGSPEDPIQFIDVRDLAEWSIRLCENRTAGVFNAMGPDKVLTFGMMLESCIKANGNTPTLRWAPASFLMKHGVSPWQDMPVWIPPGGESGGFHRRSNAKALAAGLTFRSPQDTAKATLTWWKTLPEGRRAQMRAGLKPAREAELLALLKEG